MARENVKKFFEELAKNKELQEKINTSNQKHKGEELTQEQKDFICEKELLPIAKEYGFGFTISELNEFNNEIAKTNAEVMDEEMEQVTGGFVGGFSCIIGGGDGVPLQPGQSVPDVYVCTISGNGGQIIGADVSCVCVGIAGVLMTKR